jgi:hypothetical protein
VELVNLRVIGRIPIEAPTLHATCGDQACNAARVEQE